jgi:hypothetical protein
MVSLFRAQNLPHGLRFKERTPHDNFATIGFGFKKAQQ